MHTASVRLRRWVVVLGLAGLGACQATERLAPTDPPSAPPPEIAPFTIYLDIDVVNGTVTVSPPQSAAYRSAGGRAFSLAGAELVGVSTSNVYRSPVGVPTSTKRTITFDMALTNRLSVTDLVTPTFPASPHGLQGIIAFPYTVAAFGVNGGKAVPSADWNGDGVTPHSGDPVNFFNDFGSCGTAVTSDCYRWELFPTPLAPAQTTATHKVGFVVDKNVTSVGVYLVVAADLVDHPPPPPQPGLGALLGTVSSANNGAGGGGMVSAIVTLTPGGRSTATDGVGKYLFTGLAVGPYSVAVSGVPSGCGAPAPNSATITSGGVTTSDFSVTCQAPTGGVTGTAITLQGGVLANAAVELRTIPALVLAGQTTTSPTGVYTLTGISPGAYVVMLTGLTPPCPANSPPVNVTITAGTTATTSLSVDCSTAPSPGSISGTASSPQLGGLGGVTVELRTATGGLVTQTATDNVGAYHFDAVPPGGYAVWVIGLAAPCPTSGGPVAVIAALGVVATADISVDCSAPANRNVIGLVSSPTLGPLNGLTIAATVNGVVGPTTVSSGAGNFGYLLNWPSPAAATVSLTITAGLPAACVTPPAEVILVPKGGAGNAVITVDCSGGAIGDLLLTLTDNNNQPLAQVTVQVQGPQQRVLTGQTSSLGQLPGSGLAVGTWTASVTAGLPLNCVAPPATNFQITASTTTNVALMATCTSTATPLIDGVVSSPTLGPLDGVTVQLTNPFGTFSTLTGGGGHYQFDTSVCPGIACQTLTSAGTVTLVAGLPAACVAPAPSVAPGTTPLISLPISVDCTGGGGVGTISGSVRDATFSDPLAVPVSATSSPGGQSVTARSAPTDGGYVLNNVTAGQVTISPTWLPAQCAAISAQTVTLAAGGTVTVDFPLSCPRLFYGQVTSPTLGALDGVTVTKFSSFDNSPMQTTQTSAGGYFSFDDLTFAGAGGAFFAVTNGLPAGCVAPAQRLVLLSGNNVAQADISIACP